MNSFVETCRGPISFCFFFSNEISVRRTQPRFRCIERLLLIFRVLTRRKGVTSWQPDIKLPASNVRSRSFTWSNIARIDRRDFLVTGYRRLYFSWYVGVESWSAGYSKTRTIDCGIVWKLENWEIEKLLENLFTIEHKQNYSSLNKFLQILSTNATTYLK